MGNLEPERMDVEPPGQEVSPFSPFLARQFLFKKICFAEKTKTSDYLATAENIL